MFDPFHTSHTMTFQDEPRNCGSRDLGSLGLTASEINELLTSADGHGLCNYLQENCWHQISSGSNLKTPFRVLWYAECLGLTAKASINGKDDFKAIALREILDCINRSNELNGKKPVSVSTVYNALSPLARQLEKAFGIKLLVNRHEETIKLLSEAWTANLFSSMRADQERLLKKWNDNLMFAERVGVDLSKVIAGSEMQRTQKILAGAAQ